MNLKINFGDILNLHVAYWMAQSAQLESQTNCPGRMATLFRTICITVVILAAAATISLAQSSLNDKTKGMQKYDGYMNFYYDDTTGKIWLVVDQLDAEFIYVNSLAAGLGSNDIGLDRGQLGSTRVVSFRKSGPKLLLVQPNLSYRAITDNESEARSVREAFAESALWGFKIEVEQDDKYLIDITDFLFRDAHDVTGTLRNQRQGTYRVDASRTAMYLPRTKNFPKNSEFEVTITFVGGDDAGGFVRSVTPSREAITLRQHHSFVELPDNNYKPRKLEPRAGYFGISYMDYSTPVSEPITQRYIARHRLEKKNPSAQVSEAVEPIVYYLDNGTPEPIRSALLDGARWWNEAFEAIGYKDAYRVEVLPEDADPLDVRYNVIQWVHRSTRGWSYGSSVTDPRTGEIIKGHVSLGSLRVRQDYLIAEGLLSPYEEGREPDPAMLELALARLRQLSAHEVGHTIGIMHNFAASTNGRASVMDYPHPYVTLKPDGSMDLSDAYDVGIGAWDKMAVAYGYQHFPDGTDEDAALNAIIEKGLKDGLRHITDRDARATGGSHPYAHLWDNGGDATVELERLLALRKAAMSRFGENSVPQGRALTTLEEVLVPLYNMHRYQIEAVSKLVGGLEYTYAVRGDGQAPTKAVSNQTQLNALRTLMKSIDPTVLEIPADAVDLMAPRAPGAEPNRELFSKRTGVTFDALSPAEALSDFTIGLIFNTERANRIVQQAARGLSPSLTEVLNETIQATFKSQRKTGMQLHIQLQTEQILLTHLMNLALDSGSAPITRAIAKSVLADLNVYVGNQLKSASDPIVRAHLQFAVERIANPSALPASPARTLPPGAPIGSFDNDHSLQCGLEDHDHPLPLRIWFNNSQQ
jgi:hypothetical protein